MTNVFRRVIVGMFTAMLVSLYLSVGQKGNKHSLRARVTYRGIYAARTIHTEPAELSGPSLNEGMFHATVKPDTFHVKMTLYLTCWIQKLMIHFLLLQIMYLWHLSKWIPVDRTFHMMFCTVLGERDQLRVQRVPCTTNFQHLDRNFT